MIKESANRLLTSFEASLVLNGNAAACRGRGPFYAGVDLGTAYTVTAVVDGAGVPVAGALTRSRSSIRDGVVLDYMGAVRILGEQIKTLKSAGFDIETGAAAYPPGILERNAKVFSNVLQSVGIEVSGLVEEPTAAAMALDISEGAVVDIGGGTTGISVIREGRVVTTADEPTGGIHADLVIAGHYRISTEEAERIKSDSRRQAEIFPLIRPVFQKMASIVSRHLQGHAVSTLYLVGGTSCFPGIEEVMAAETGIEVEKPVNPLLVTPLGIALYCLEAAASSAAAS